jgi:hypothetical protein
VSITIIVHFNLHHVPITSQSTPDHSSIQGQRGGYRGRECTVRSISFVVIARGRAIAAVPCNNDGLWVCGTSSRWLECSVRLLVLPIAQ